MAHTLTDCNGFDHGNETLFARIADDILQKGYSINPAALPAELADKLLMHLHEMSEDKFDPAGIGRDQQLIHNDFVRRDEICWITGNSDAGQAWLNWTARLQNYLNRRLFLGLFSFESHFAHYTSGDFYKRHYDAFKGEGNRVLSVVVYLNHNWAKEHGGELVLYINDEDNEGINITPNFGTIAVFLSEDFPHEVKPAYRDRYSIAGWFRINSSTSERVDPPR